MGTYAFDKKNTKMLTLKLNIRTDADILARIAQEPNKQSYIKSLIRADIAAHSAEQSEAEGEQSIDCRTKPALPEGKSAGRRAGTAGKKEGEPS